MKWAYFVQKNSLGELRGDFSTQSKSRLTPPKGNFLHKIRRRTLTTMNNHLMIIRTASILVNLPIKIFKLIRYSIC